jgi:uncharacterized protein (DUF4415 family)
MRCLMKTSIYQIVQKVTLMIDRDVFDWFKAQGDKADLQMALALKIYAEANKAYSTGNNP